jgi:hypothetical protein
MLTLIFLLVKIQSVICQEMKCFSFFCKNIFAKYKNEFLQNFCENTKAKIVVSTSVAEPHNFYVALAPALLYIKPKFFKVKIRSDISFSSDSV